MAVLCSPGAPLQPHIRTAMEAAFGHDFSDVRVHDDSRAAASSQALGARAYTVGRHIVFGAEQYDAASSAGRGLIAHELAHVIQQRAAASTHPGMPRIAPTDDHAERTAQHAADAAVAHSARTAPTPVPGRAVAMAAGREPSVIPGTVRSVPLLQRKEVLGSSRDLASLAPTDWFRNDVDNWRRDLFVDHRENTFVKAARYNTKNNLSGEYTTIFLRSEYYAVVNSLLQQSTGTRDVEFFAATAKVTSGEGVGAIEGINPLLPLLLHTDPETERILRDVNRLLFSANMKIINKLTGPTGTPTDPRVPSATATITPMDFDLDMVETEQSLVEDYLTAHASEITPQAKKEINDDLNFRGFFRSIGELLSDTTFLTWAKQALSVAALNFFVKQHRIAAGKALVFQLHGRSLNDYKSYMASGRL
jgi:hypothetical protein